MRDRGIFATRTLFLIATAALAVMPVTAAPPKSPRTRFDIPAEDLGTALTALARQTNREIYFASDLTRGKRAPRLQGQWTLEQALGRMLAGSGLTYRVNANGSIVVEAGSGNGNKTTQEAPAAAPDAAPTSMAGEPSDQSQNIVVTGSRALTNGNAAPTPVTIIGRDQLNLTAPTSIADALAQVPEFRSSSRPSSFVTPQTVTGAFLNLRGLGQNRVLTLLDGRRVVPTTADGRIDVNTFPDLLIKRVDIVTGGASAAYGSDAVAGVVNFVLDDEYRGIKGDVGSGISDDGDNRSYKARIAAGTALLDGRLHLTGSFDFFKSKGVLSADTRDWDRRHCNVIQNPTFATDSRTAFLFRCGVTGTQYATGGVIISGPLQGTQFVGGGVPAPFAYGTEVTAATMIGGDGYWNSRGNLSMPIDTKTGFVHAAFDPTDAIRIWAEGSWSRTQSFFYGTSPSYSTGTAFTIFRDNAFLDATTRARMVTANLQSFALGRISPDWGRNVGRNDTKTYRGAFGFRADLGGTWIADGAFDIGHTYTSQRNEHSPNQTRLFEAIDAVVNPANGQIVCRSALAGIADGCAPLNPFGPGSASAASLAYVFQDGYADNYADQQSGELNLRGRPFRTWAGDVSVAVGTSVRHLETEIIADPLSLTPIVPVANTRGYPASLVNKIGVFLTGNFFSQPKKAITVKEAYGEVQVPLAHDLPFLQSLDLNGAYRYADYSTTGGVSAWKIGGSWEPADWLRLRITRSRDVRAPNLTELYQPPQAQLGPVIDPRTGVSNNLTRYFVGNPNLTTEIANSLTAGMVFKPAFLPGFSASIDYYDIKIGNAVGQLTAQQIINLCESGSTSYCQFVARLPNGTLTSVTVAYLNQNVLKDRGLDFEANYATDIGPVHAHFRALVSYLDTLSTTDLFGTTLEAAGVNGGELEGTPNWQASGSITATYQGSSAFLQVRTISGGLYSNQYVVGGRAANSIDFNHVDGRTYFDLTLRQKIKAPGNPEFYLTVNNLFDVDPPAAPTRVGAPASILGTNPTLYDVIGRQFNFGVRFNF